MGKKKGDSQQTLANKKEHDAEIMRMKQQKAEQKKLEKKGDGKKLEKRGDGKKMDTGTAASGSSSNSASEKTDM